MPVSVDISVQTRNKGWKTVLTNKAVKKACEAALSHRGVKRSKASELTVVLAGDAFVRTLNRDFRGQDKPTNVLSFPSDTPDELGDIVLALQTVKREAREQGKPVRNHAVHLLVHGTLHLLGYDHMQEKEAGAMEQLEIKILKKLSISNPYL